MRFPGIGALVVGLGVLWVSLAQAQQVGFTQEDRERIDRRFDQVEKQMVRMETTTADVHGVHQSAFRADAEHDGPALCRTA